MNSSERDKLNNSDTLASHLGIEFLEVSKNKLVARMPVDQRTKQPYGLLHGGASGVLVETLASVGAMLNLDQPEDSAVGVELHCRHLSSARDGWVVGTAVPEKLGKSIHFWKVQVVKEGSPENIICEGTCTLFVKRK